MKDRYQTKFWLKVLSSFCLLGVCIYVCVRSCLDKYINVATWPPQTKISDFALALTQHIMDPNISLYAIMHGCRSNLADSNLKPSSFKSKNASIALTYSFISSRSLNYLSYKFCMTIFFQPIQWSDKSTGFFLNLRSSDIRVKLLKFCLAKTNILYSSNPIYKTTTYWSFIYLLWSNLIVYLFL